MLKSLSATDLTTMSDTSASLQHSNVYVKHLPNEVASEAAVRELFQQYGPIECVRLVVRPAQLNLMRSFAFVKFRHLEDAANAITALDGTELQGSVLEVKAADADAGDRKPELAAPPCDNLYVKNLPVECTQEEVQAMFAAHGEVLTIRMLHAPAASKAGRGMQQRHGSPGSDGSTPMGTGALVRMGTVEQACKAVAALHNSRMESSSLPLVVRYADGQEQKLRKAARQQRLVPRQTQQQRHPRPQQGQQLSPGTNGFTPMSRSCNSSSSSLQGDRDCRPWDSSNGSSSAKRSPLQQRRRSKLGPPPPPATQDRFSDRPGYSPPAAAPAAAGYGGYLYTGYTSYGYPNGSAYSMHSPYGAAAVEPYQQQVWTGYPTHQQQQVWSGGYPAAQHWPAYSMVVPPGTASPPTPAATPGAVREPPRAAAPAAAKEPQPPAVAADANGMPDLTKLHIGPAHPSRSVCVQGLPPTADKLYLYERFGRYGAILGVQLVTSAGDTTGYITFDTPEAATRAAAAADMPQQLENGTYHHHQQQQQQGRGGEGQGKQYIQLDHLQVTVCPASDMVQGSWVGAGKPNQRQHMPHGMQLPAGKAAAYTAARRGSSAASYDC